MGLPWGQWGQYLRRGPQKYFQMWFFCILGVQIKPPAMPLRHHSPKNLNQFQLGVISCFCGLNAILVLHVRKYCTSPVFDVTKSLQPKKIWVFGRLVVVLIKLRSYFSCLIAIRVTPKSCPVPKSMMPICKHSITSISETPHLGTIFYF